MKRYKYGEPIKGRRWRMTQDDCGGPLLWHKTIQPCRVPPNSMYFFMAPPL